MNLAIAGAAQPRAERKQEKRRNVFTLRLEVYLYIGIVCVEVFIKEVWRKQERNCLDTWTREGRETKKSRLLKVMHTHTYLHM